MQKWKTPTSVEPTVRRTPAYVSSCRTLGALEEWPTLACVTILNVLGDKWVGALMYLRLIANFLAAVMIAHCVINSRCVVVMATLTTTSVFWGRGLQGPVSTTQAGVSLSLTVVPPWRRSVRGWGRRAGVSMTAQPVTLWCFPMKGAVPSVVSQCFLLKTTPLDFHPTLCASYCHHNSTPYHTLLYVARWLLRLLSIIINYCTPLQTSAISQVESAISQVDIALPYKPQCNISSGTCNSKQDVTT